MSNLNFKNKKLEQFVVVTVTNWSEPPRFRHEVARQLSRFYNVLFVQIYSQRRYKRKSLKVNDNLIVEKAGLAFPGLARVLVRFPILRRIYNLYIRLCLKKVVKKFGFSNANIVNFQFDFPEAFSLKLWKKKIYFCNDDFVNQDGNLAASLIEKKDLVQRETIGCSDLVITVSEPLKDSLSRYSNNVKVILSGHNFDINKSLQYGFFPADIRKIKACYLGVLNQGVAIDWLENIASREDVSLTMIGPVAQRGWIENLMQSDGFNHHDTLVGERLQEELLKHDVLLMPYSSPVENKVTSVPAKLFEYLAVGKPVVSSSLENLIELPNFFVYKSDSCEMFYNNIKKSVLDDNDLLRISRIEFASQHTWNDRGDALIEYFNDL